METMNARGTVEPFNRQPNRDYPSIVRAEGSYLWDAHGKKYLDAASGALVSNIGHGRVEVAEVAARQIRQVDFVHGSQFTSPAFDELTEALSPFVPAGSWRFFATSGGSEATESAIKLARQVQLERGHAARRIIVSRSISYHGASLGALAASGVGARRVPYEPLINDAAFEKLGAIAVVDTVESRVADFEALLNRVGAENVAALMLEPVIGAASPGLASPDGTYEAYRRICDEHGILLIFDEVMTGLGRCGRGLALEHWTVTPDIVVLGKGLGAGYAPLGGILATEGLVESVVNGSGAFMHGFTYAGHPVSVAVGAKVLQLLHEEQLVAAAASSGERLKDDLLMLAKEHPEIQAVRGYGLLIGVMLGMPGEAAPLTKPGYAYDVAQAALAVGLNLYPGTGSARHGLGDHLLIGPPLNFSTDERAELMEKLNSALSQAGHKLKDYITAGNY